MIGEDEIARAVWSASVGGDLASACAVIAEQWTEISAAQFAQLQVLAGRDHGPRLLTTALAEGNLAVNRREFAVIVLDVWGMVEHPMLHLGREEWRDLFIWAGSSPERHLTPSGRRMRSPDSPLTLYRGAPEESRAGMSWTESRATAQWFAARHHAAKVWTAQVEPWRLLARIHGPDSRGEREWVIDSDELTIG